MLNKLFTAEHPTPSQTNKIRMAEIKKEFIELGIQSPVILVRKRFPKYLKVENGYGLALRNAWNGSSGREEVVNDFETVLQEAKEELKQKLNASR